MNRNMRPMENVLPTVLIWFLNVGFDWIKQMEENGYSRRKKNFMCTYLFHHNPQFLRIIPTSQDCCKHHELMYVQHPVWWLTHRWFQTVSSFPFFPEDTGYDSMQCPEMKKRGERHLTSSFANLFLNIYYAQHARLDIMPALLKVIVCFMGKIEE